MGTNLSNRIIGYHYSNPLAYDRIEDSGGLIPRHRFIRPCDHVPGLPNEAYEFVTEGLLEPTPSSWVHNEEFPLMWKYLMFNICREKEVTLLSFQLQREDRAYILEWSHVERELHREGEIDQGQYVEAFTKCWESRTSVFQYEGNFSVPLLAIWSPIPFERLKVEWVKNKTEILQQWKKR